MRRKDTQIEDLKREIETKNKILISIGHADKVPNSAEIIISAPPENKFVLNGLPKKEENVKLPSKDETNFDTEPESPRKKNSQP